MGSQFLSLVMAGLAVGSIYALMALAMNLIFAAKRIVNFAHGELVMFAGLAGFFVISLWGWGYVAGLIAACLAVMAIAVLIERIAIRPLPGDETNIAWILSIMAVALIVANGMQLLFGTETRPFPSLVGSQPVMVGTLRLIPQELLTVLVTVALMVAFHLLQNRTLFGKAMKATARDPEVASLLGISVQRYIVAAFAVSGLLAVIAGFLIGPMTFVTPRLGFVLGVKGFAAAALGGLGTFGGAVAGGLVLGLAESLAGGYVGSAAKDSVAFLLLILVLLLRPTGLVGEVRVDKV